MADYLVTDTELTSIANAIRTKGGTSASLEFPQEFVQAINDIETGGGGATVEELNITQNGTYVAPSGTAYSPVSVDVPNYTDIADLKEVVFIDYDGTVLYQYSADEFLSMESLPPNPSQSGLVAEGWNWTLESAKAFVEEYGCVCIGQNYRTDDGCTRIYMDVDEWSVGCTASLRFEITNSGNVTIDWGDGSATNTQNGNGTKSPSHVYSSIGQYVIKIKLNSGNYYLGYNGSNTGFLFPNSNTETAFKSLRTYRKIEIGDGCIGLHRQCFSRLLNCTKVSIPRSVARIGSGTTGNALNEARLYAVVLPPSVEIIGGNNFNSNFAFVSFPYTPVNVNNTSLGNMLQFLSAVSNNSTITYVIGSSGGVNRIKHYAIGGNYGTTSTGTAQFAVLLNKIVLPTTVTTINDYSFNNCFSATLYLRQTTPPTLANTRGINFIKRIVVPYSADHSVLNAYKSASNWSSYASKIVEEEP